MSGLESRVATSHLHRFTVSQHTVAHRLDTLNSSRTLLRHLRHQRAAPITQSCRLRALAPGELRTAPSRDNCLNIEYPPTAPQAMATRSLPTDRNEQLQNPPQHSILVEKRCLGRTELKVKQGQVGTTNATKPSNLGRLDYVHLRVDLPSDLHKSGIFQKGHERKYPNAYFLMVSWSKISR